MTDLIEEMAAARRSWTNSLLTDWYTPDQLDAALVTAMKPEAERVADADFGTAFRDNVATINVPDPLAWANRRIGLPDGHWCVTGIRYRALDPTKPFIDIIATTVPPTVDALADVVDTVLPLYDSFAPRAVRVDAPDPDHLVRQATAHTSFERAAVDQYIVAGRITDLLNRSARPGFDRIQLVPITSDSAVALVTDLYARAATCQPDLHEWARPARPDHLDDAHTQGLLFQILLDDQPAGVVAARREDDHAVTGFVVEEMILDPAHHGARLATPTQQHLLHALHEGPARDGDTLWGSIHPDNTPSLRNAFAVGRTTIGAYVWLTPAGLPGH